MILYVNNNGIKVNISAYAHTRCELAQKLGDPVQIKIDGAWHTYNIDEVYAKPAGNLGPAFMVIGALIGLLGGPIGVILGGLAGGVMGRMEDAKEEDKAKIFNGCYAGGLHDAPAM
jgi:hypothetical protein